jgi:hypothetical protein
MKFLFVRVAAIATILYVSAFAVSTRAMAQSPLDWQTAQTSDTGIQPSIAVTPSGLVVETHRSEHNDGKVWYRVGKIGQSLDKQYFIRWGKSHTLLDYPGLRPTVAITKEGYVLLVYTRLTYTGYNGPVMRYFVGTLNPDGDSNQTIDWKIINDPFDTGQYARFAFTSSGKLVEVHESGNNSNLFYRIGHFFNPAQGNFVLIWDSTNGNGGVRYDSGANPTISVNDNNQIIESHQQRAGYGMVDYRRGILGPRSISFATSGGTTYDKETNHPDVALTDKGLVVQAAATFGGNFKKGVVLSRTGLLNDDPTLVTWSGTVGLGWPDWPGEQPSVATNGQVAVAIWTGGDRLFTATAGIPK